MNLDAGSRFLLTVCHLRPHRICPRPSISGHSFFRSASSACLPLCPWPVQSTQQEYRFDINVCLTAAILSLVKEMANNASDNAANAAPKQRGRPFPKGKSSNPAGRPAASRHRISLLVKGLIESRAEELAERALQSALAGDGVLLKAVLDRLAPPRKERPVAVDLPALTSPADAPAIAAALLQKAAAGALTPSEAAGLAGLLESYRRPSELADIVARLKAPEERRP